uniref:Uncharacterized protein n=1 Tax=viral metagenome TaxID=1070528 RepID=A0A6C0JRW0_9ZZZZ
MSKSYRNRSRKNKSRRNRSRKNRLNKFSSCRGGNPYACSSNTEPIIKNSGCDNEYDSITSDLIKNGYCLGNQCLDKKTIQQLRLNYIIPRKDNYSRSDHRKKVGDLNNPFTREIISNEQIRRAGLKSPNRDGDYLDDKEYNLLLDNYKEAIKRKQAFEKIGPIGKSILNGERVGFNRAYG